MRAFSIVIAALSQLLCVTSVQFADNGFVRDLKAHFPHESLSHLPRCRVIVIPTLARQFIAVPSIVCDLYALRMFMQ